MILWVTDWRSRCLLCATALDTGLPEAAEAEGAEEAVGAKGADLAAAAAAESRQSCLTLCDPRDDPPGSPVPGRWARTLEWVAISFSNAWKWKVKVKSLSCVQPSWPQGLQPTRLLRPWDFPGKSTGVGCHHLLRLYFVRSIEITCVPLYFTETIF